MTGISYKQHVIEDRWDAIVVGSGIGGLTAAALLSKYGRKQVLVLERHYTPGGYTHSFHRPGYEWDVGVHYIGEVQNPQSPLRRAFDHLTEGALQWAPMPDVYDRLKFGDRTYDFVRGEERFRERLQQYFPRETVAIDRYLAAIRSAARWMGLYFAEKAVPGPIAAVAGRWMRAPYLRWAARTTASVLREITTNRELTGVLTAQWGDYGLPPEQSSFGAHAMIASHYLEGASYPVGGASRIAETMAPLIENNGGQIVSSADVSQILIENNRAVGVKMADGREFRSDLVISDAGARNTYGRLLRSPNPKIGAIQTQIANSPASLSFLSLYVGLKQTPAQLGLTGTNLWMFPGYDHDANAARFARDPSAPFAALFLSFPSAKDPQFELRHPGRATLEVVTFAPYDWFAQWEASRWKRRGADYDAFKRELAQRMQTELERHVPAVAGKIDHAELSTPLSARHFMNYERGEAYGLGSTPERYGMRWLAPRTPVRGLYLTGQDVVSLGVSGAMMGGVVSASAVLGRNLMSTVTKPFAQPVRRSPALTPAGSSALPL